MVVMAAGGVVMIVGSLVPWVRTGGARRNSYDLLSLVDRLGFAPDGPAEAALRWWPLMPLLVAVAVVAAWWGWPRAGGALGVVAAVYGGGVGLAVTRSDADSGAGRGRAHGDVRRSVDPRGRLDRGDRRQLHDALDATEHVAQHRRTVGHDPVDTEVEQPAHLRWVVDRPHVDVDAAPVHPLDEALVDHGEPAATAPAPAPPAVPATSTRSAAARPARRVRPRSTARHRAGGAAGTAAGR